LFKSRRFVGLLALLLVAGTASAADLRSGSSSSNGNVVVSSTEEVGNLYTAGGQVSVDASPSKDLVVGGGMVDVNGKVGRNLIAAGGNVTVRGDVVASARIAGGSIHISSKSIGEDLVIAGGNVYVGPETLITGDLIVAAGNANIEGAVHGNVKFIGGTLVLNGRVDGNVDAKAKQYFALGPQANIKGDINYSSRSQYNRDANAQVAGAVNYSATPSNRSAVGALLTLALLLKLLGMIVVAFILFAIWKARFIERSTHVGNGFWKNAGIGLLGAILIPIIAAILFVTIIGYYAAIILLLLYVLIWLVSALFAAAYLGGWIISKVDKRAIRIDYVTIALGIIIYSIVAIIPVIGTLAIIILTIAAFGSVLRNYKHN